MWSLGKRMCAVGGARGLTRMEGRSEGGPWPTGFKNLAASPLLPALSVWAQISACPACASVSLTACLSQLQPCKPPGKPPTLCAPLPAAGPPLCQSPAPPCLSTGPPASTEVPGGAASACPPACAPLWELGWPLERGASPAASRWAGTAQTSWGTRSSLCRTWTTAWQTTWRRWGTWSRPTTSWRSRSRRPWRRAAPTSETTANTRASSTTWGRRWDSYGFMRFIRQTHVKGAKRKRSSLRSQRLKHIEKHKTRTQWALKMCSK